MFDEMVVCVKCATKLRFEKGRYKGCTLGFDTFLYITFVLSYKILIII